MKSANDIAFLEKAIEKKFRSLTAAVGELVMPCVPAMLDLHMKQILGLLQGLGINLTPAEIDSLRLSIAKRLAEGFEASPFSRLVFKYQPPTATQGLTSGLKLTTSILDKIGIEDKYNRWIKTRSGPLFGSHPDAKVMAIAATLTEPSNAPILDVGAGTGRNTMPLARRGHPVQALELTPAFAQQILIDAQKENLPVGVTQGNVLDRRLYLEPNHYSLALVAEVIPHLRDLEQVRTLLAKMCEAIKPGGLLLFNVFLTVDGYEPSDKVRQMAQIAWSYLLTPKEFASVVQGLPLEIKSNESAFEYERAHQTPEAWPPTNWFVSWSTGRNIFPVEEQPPVELRWILAVRN